MRKIIISVTLCMVLPLIQAQKAAAETTDETISENLIEIPAEKIIETENHGYVSLAVQELVDEIELENQINQAFGQILELTENPFGNTANSGGGVFVTYDPTNTPPANIQTAINSAAAIWDDALATHPSGPVEIYLSWQSFGNQSVLGFGGPETQFQGESLPTNYTYSAALANTILGVDANGGNRPEIEITLNSDLYASGRFFSSPTGSPAYNQIDVETLALHEIAHGLGFTGSARNNTGTPKLDSIPNVYDSLILVDGVKLINKSNPDAHLATNNLDITLGGGLTYKVYDPHTWQSGSSFSHFDEASYPTGHPGSLMSPVLTSGTINRTLSSTVLGVMNKMGWPLAAQTLPITIGNVSSTNNSIKLNWNLNTSTSGALPDQIETKTYKGSALINSKVVSPVKTSTTISNLQPGTNYTIKLKTISSYGSKTKTISKSTSNNIPVNELASVTKSSTVRPVPLDGQIARLYQAYFLRKPDANGFSYWKRVRAEGNTAISISETFANSPEFNARYGSLNNQQFVSLIYKNVLKRTPDTEGYNFWVGQLNSGKSKGEIMLGFSDSAEFASRTRTVLPNTYEEGKIGRAYSAVFLRTPDTAGSVYWQSVFSSGVPLNQITESFTSSNEFVKRYGNLSNSDFINLVYRNVLKRSPDSAGFDFWLYQLDSGMSRGEMMANFSESVENILISGYLP